jgi:hypothetical protein
MLNRPLVVATITAALAVATVSTRAEAGDPVLGALIGGGIGAAIGHGINGRHGGVAGGVVGAIVGSSIAANSSGYYDNGYYAPAPRYYASAPVYYSAPAPVYYAPSPVYYGPSVVVSSGPYYGYRHFERVRWHGDRLYR